MTPTFATAHALYCSAESSHSCLSILLIHIMQGNCRIRKALRYFCTPCGRDKLASLTVQSRNYSMEKRQEATAKINDSTNSFFNYTSGRWL